MAYTCTKISILDIKSQITSTCGLYLYKDGAVFQNTITAIAHSPSSNFSIVDPEQVSAHWKAAAQQTFLHAQD